jgi:hypothetical protein
MTVMLDHGMKLFKVVKHSTLLRLFQSTVYIPSIYILPPETL